MEQFKALSIASKDLITISADETLITARKLMCEKKIRHLIVKDNDKAIGVLSDRDVMKAMRIQIEEFYAYQVRNETLDPDFKVRDVMSWPIKSLADDTPLAAVVDVMLKEKISSLMLTQENALVGIITTDDLLEILRRHINNEQATFWGEDIVNNVYSTPIRSVLEVLSNTGI
ncbi:MAG: CBS domain-containing protein [Bdellovibrionota bacterium]